VKRIAKGLLGHPERKKSQQGLNVCQHETIAGGLVSDEAVPSNIEFFNIPGQSCDTKVAASQGLKLFE
jgi:hypothetical protein